MAEVELRAEFIDQASSNVERLAENVKRLGEAYLGLEGIKKLVENITQAQEATDELDRMFKQFGATVGVTRENMEQYARTIQQITTLTSESVLKAQAALLNYTSITGEQFVKVRQLAVDLSQKMGGDAAEAARDLGRALENPIAGMRLLAQVGVVLNEAQRETIRLLVEEGQTASVQRYLIDQLTIRTRGLAEASADTLGGALKQLKNNFSSLFEGQGANVRELTDRVKELSSVLSGKEMQQSMQNLVAGIVTFAEWIARAVTSAGDLAKNLGEGAAKLFHGSDDPTQRLKDEKRDLLGRRAFNVTSPSEYARINARIAEIDKELTSRYNDQIDALSPIEVTAKRLTTADIPGRVQLPQPVREIIAGAGGGRTRGSIDENSVFANSFLPGSILKQYFDDTASANEQAADEFRKKASELIDLAVAGAISDADFKQKGNDLLDQLLPEVKASQVAKKIQVPVSDAIKSLQAGFEDMFNRLDFRAKSFGQLFLDVLKSIFAKDLAQEFISSLSKIFAKAQSGGGSGGFWGSIIGGIGHLFGFANGGEFTVGGSGGTDSQFVAFKASPGERVSVSPPGMSGGFVYSPITNISAAPETDLAKINAIIQINNDHQRVEWMRMLERNGYGRLR